MELTGARVPIHFQWRQVYKKRMQEKCALIKNRRLRNEQIYNQSSIVCLLWLKNKIKEMNETQMAMNPSPGEPHFAKKVLVVDGVAGAGKSFVLNLLLDCLNCIATGSTHTATRGLPSKVSATTIHKAIGVNCSTLNLIKNVDTSDLEYKEHQGMYEIIERCRKTFDSVLYKLSCDSSRLIVKASSCVKQWYSDRDERPPGDHQLTPNIFCKLMAASNPDMSPRAWMLVNNVVVIDEAGQAPYYYLVLLYDIWRALNKACNTPQFVAGKDLIIIAVGSTSQSSAMHRNSTVPSIMDFCLSDPMDSYTEHCKFLDNRRCTDDDTARLVKSLESGVVNDPVSFAQAEAAVRSRKLMMDPFYEPYRKRLFSDHASVRKFIKCIKKSNEKDLIVVNRLFLITDATPAEMCIKVSREGFYSDWKDALVEDLPNQKQVPKTKLIQNASDRHHRVLSCAKSYIKNMSIVCSDSCTGTMIGYRGSICQFHANFRENFSPLIDRLATVTAESVTYLFAKISMNMMAKVITYLDEVEKRIVEDSGRVVNNRLIYTRENILSTIYQNTRLVECLGQREPDVELDALLHGQCDFMLPVDPQAARINILSGTEFTLLESATTHFEFFTYDGKTYNTLIAPNISLYKEVAKNHCKALVLLQNNGIVMLVPPKIYIEVAYVSVPLWGKKHKDDETDDEVCARTGKYAITMDHPFTLSKFAQTICKSQGTTVTDVIVSSRNCKESYTGISRAEKTFQTDENILNNYVSNPTVFGQYHNFTNCLLKNKTFLAV